MFSRRSELRLVRQAGLRRSSALGILISTRINSYFMLVILFIDIQLGRLTPMSEYPCSGASAERPRPRGQSRCQGPAREDAGAPLRRRWLRLLLKHYQRRAKVTAPLRGKSKSSNLCKADHLKLNKPCPESDRPPQSICATSPSGSPIAFAHGRLAHSI